MKANAYKREDIPTPPGLGPQPLRFHEEGEDELEEEEDEELRRVRTRMGEAQVRRFRRNEVTESSFDPSSAGILAAVCEGTGAKKPEGNA